MTRGYLDKMCVRCDIGNKYFYNSDWYIEQLPRATINCAPHVFSYNRMTIERSYNDDWNSSPTKAVNNWRDLFYTSQMDSNLCNPVHCDLLESDCSTPYTGDKLFPSHRNPYGISMITNVYDGYEVHACQKCMFGGELYNLSSSLHFKQKAQDRYCTILSTSNNFTYDSPLELQKEHGWVSIKDTIKAIFSLEKPDICTFQVRVLGLHYGH